MKSFSIILLGTLISLAAHAHQSEVEPPLRMAKLTGRVMKTIDDGSGRVPKDKLVCEFNTEVPVYAPLIKGQRKSHPSVRAAECQTIMKRRNLYFDLDSDIHLTESKDGKPEGKTLRFSMAFYKDRKTASTYSFQTVHLTGDKGAVHLGTSFTILDNLHGPVREYLSVRVNAEDVNQ